MIDTASECAPKNTTVQPRDRISLIQVSKIALPRALKVARDVNTATSTLDSKLSLLFSIVKVGTQLTPHKPGSPRCTIPTIVEVIWELLWKIEAACLTCVAPPRWGPLIQSLVH